MNTYALNIEKETGRVLSATYAEYAGADMPLVENLPDGDITEYLYVNGEYIHSPLPAETVVETPTQLDRMEAQLTYTAMMTDTLLEV